MKVPRDSGLFPDPCDRFVGKHLSFLAVIALSTVKRKMYPPIIPLSSSISNRSTSNAGVLANWKAIATAE